MDELNRHLSFESVDRVRRAVVMRNPKTNKFEVVYNVTGSKNDRPNHKADDRASAIEVAKLFCGCKS
jgi:hypothetical protein